LKKIEGLEEAYIFGSYARDKLNVLSDVDLLIIGSHKSLDADKAILPLYGTLGREINTIDMTKKEFEGKKRKKNPLIKDIFSKPVIKII